MIKKFLNGELVVRLSNNPEDFLKFCAAYDLRWPDGTLADEVSWLLGNRCIRYKEGVGLLHGGRGYYQKFPELYDVVSSAEFFRAINAIKEPEEHEEHVIDLDSILNVLA